MKWEIIRGILIPFLGTSLGASCVLFMKNMLNVSLQRVLNGFAAGVMLAASVWSLLIPAMEQAASMKQWAFVPAVAGFWAGILFLLVLDRAAFHLCPENGKPQGMTGTQKGTAMLVFAVTLHNIPEGMAVGAVFAGCLSGNSAIAVTEAMALSIGIAVQNFPEGAIISMPLKAEGMKKSKAFIYGVLSGVVEPLAAVVTILASGIVVPVLPFMLSFAAGAMVYVVIEELIPELSASPHSNLGTPEISAGLHSNLGTLLFAVGFTVMMALDVALG